MEAGYLYYLGPESFTTATYAKVHPDGSHGAPETLVIGDTVTQSWAAGRLKIGDIVLCREDNGDGSYDFFLIDAAQSSQKKGMHLLRGVPHPFTARGMPATKLCWLDYRLRSQLTAGQSAIIELELPA
ncbi:MAG: hypothetical protein RLZZ324_378 [Candidatus Parcubacteria bacterium]|jgi:hypothetical protein